MKAMKKLLVTFFTMAVFSICLSNPVYASELETVALEPAQGEVIEGTDQDIVTELTEEQFQDEDDPISDNMDLTSEESDPTQADDNEDEQEQDLIEQVEEDKEEAEETIVEDKKNKKEEKEEKPSYSKEDLRLLSALVYSEAGNQSYKGMLAVANVVINRVNSSVYWHVNTIKDVIYDDKWSVQFTVTIKNKKTGKSVLDKALECYDEGRKSGSYNERMKMAIKAAKAALEGENNIGDYLCFRINRNTSSIKKKYDYKILGDHIFYRTK